MAGGTWKTQNKIRPGVYIRFSSSVKNSLTVGDRGIVAICEPMSWGEVGKVTEITSDTNMLAVTGYPSITDTLFLREIFKGTDRTYGAQKVLLFRPSANGAAKAAATIGNLSATAKYEGTRGNDITVVVTENTDSTFDVSTVVSGIIYDTQIVATADELVANDWVEFSGSGELTASAGTALTGGADGTVAASAYSTFLTIIEPYQFDILCYDGDDATVITAFEQFIERIADENGQYAQLVLSTSGTPNSRFVINVQNAVTLEDGTELTPQQVCWWVAGAEAGALYNESLTYAKYPNAKSATGMTNSQVIDGINAGQLLVVGSNGDVKIETDINSLTTYTADITKIYRKNRVMRLCNTIANDIYYQFAENFIGVVNNNEAGRLRLKSEIVGYLLSLQAGAGIQNFDPSDVQISAGIDIDSVVIDIAIQAVDAVEKIYMTIEVS